MGNTASAINGLKGGRPPKYNKTQIQSLYADGYDKTQIAEKLGCNWRTVHRAVSKTTPESLPKLLRQNLNKDYFSNP